MQVAALNPDMMRATPTLNPAQQNMRRTAEDFEANFLSFMFKPMFEGLKTDGPMGGGSAEATWRSFLIDAMARQTAKAGGIGLADTVMAEMIRMQESQTPSLQGDAA